MKITRTNLKHFRMNFKNAIKDFEKANGVVIELGNIKFGSDSFSAKMEVINFDDETEDVEQVKFDKDCGRYGFDGDDYNKKLSNGRKTYNFVGFKPQNTKYPCIVENHNGRYKMTVSQVKRMLIN